MCKLQCRGFCVHWLRFIGFCHSHACRLYDARYFACVVHVAARFACVGCDTLLASLATFTPPSRRWNQRGAFVDECAREETMVQKSHESMYKYWATRSSVRSFARIAHSFTCSALLASLARSAALIRSLARSIRSLPSSWVNE